MNETDEPESALKWAVHLTAEIPTVRSDLAPGQRVRMWPPISCTLIYGRRDAVLVDAPVTVEQAYELTDWLVASGRNLTTLYASHGHGDHWFGFGLILNKFPKAHAVATSNVVKVMRQQSSPEFLEDFWEARFPGQISSRLVVAEELSGNKIDLEGQELIAVEVGHSDTDYTTCLHVPSAGLVVAGDVAYNDVHMHLAESQRVRQRREWIAALDKIESLSPRAVIAGHKRAGRNDSPSIIEESRKYIRDFDRIAESTTTAQDLYDGMLEIYPDRLNPGALWSSALAVKG